METEIAEEIVEELVELSEESCPHLVDGKCVIASELAGCDVVPWENVCNTCTNCSVPQEENYVTASIAVHIWRKSGDDRRADELMRDFMEAGLFHLGQPEREKKLDKQTVAVSKPLTPGNDFLKFLVDRGAQNFSEDYLQSLQNANSLTKVEWQSNIDIFIDNLTTEARRQKFLRVLLLAVPGNARLGAKKLIDEFLDHH